MPRPRLPPTSALGTALVERRGEASLDACAEALGIRYTTLSRLERGTHRPSYATAVKLAAWLGWTTDQVMEAASTPVTPPQDVS